MELTSSVILLIAVTSFILWCALFFMLCSKYAQKSREWNYRIVALVAAVINLLMSGACEFYFTPWRFTTPGQPSTMYETTAMAFCLGYFLFDLFYSLIDQKRNAMLVHHIISLVGLCAALLSNVCGSEIMLCLFLGELSNPMLQFRFFMRSAGIKEGILYHVNDISFALTFAVVRLVIGSYLLYLYVMHPVPHVFFKISGLVFQVINFAFMAEILWVISKSIKGKHE